MMEAVIGFVGVLVGSGIAVAKDFVLSRSDQKRNGTYGAIRIVGVLDEYAQKCVDVVYDDGTIEGRPAGQTQDGEEYYVPQVSEPDPPHYPEDIDWKSLPKGLTYRALTLPNTARDANRAIIISSEHAYPPDYEPVFSARQEGYARLGLEAMQLASALRQHFGLPPMTQPLWYADWEPEAFLRDRLKEFADEHDGDSA